MRLTSFIVIASVVGISQGFGLAITEPRQDNPRDKSTIVEDTITEALVVNDYNPEYFKQSLPEPLFTVEGLIKEMAPKYGVNTDTALRIAFCESRFDPLAKNKNSTASGVYQFLNGTWERNCEGDVFNAEDNIRCCLEIYPKYPSYWECK